MKKVLFTLLALLSLAACSTQPDASLWVETEGFAQKGGWSVDQQFTFEMGSPYLIAHGMGQAVEDASTTITLPRAGKYHVWVRTYNWTSPWSETEGPGAFKLSVDGKELPTTLGTKGNKWMWQYAGSARVGQEAELKLHDLQGFDGRCDAIWLTTNKTLLPPAEGEALASFREQNSGKEIREVKYQFVVVGGGVAGICASVAAARMGTKVALINDRPIIAGCIGPFSLAGRLLNVNDIMVDCYDEPEKVHTVLEKATEFILNYIQALKDAGAHAVMMAEPLAGLLSPALMSEFSSSYVRRIVNAVQDKHFIVIYHNCGSAINNLVEPMLETGCIAYHFGESADMKQMLEKIPRNYLVMGNISPSSVFNNSNKRSMRLATTRLLDLCRDYPNFVASSGCDIPPYTDFEDIDTFFETVQAFYYRENLWDMIR